MGVMMDRQWQFGSVGIVRVLGMPCVNPHIGDMAPALPPMLFIRVLYVDGSHAGILRQLLDAA